MNPDPWELARQRARNDADRAEHAARRRRLHDAAMERRRKRKRGGKR